MIIVIPSAREINLDYLSPLVDAGARFIVVDDSPGRISIPHPQFSVFNWEDRKRLLGANEIAIPKKNGACRDFGFYIAWRESDDEEIIVALDDDCKIVDAGFADRVEACLSARPRPVMTGDGGHLNILDLYRDIPEHLYPRGFPYSRRATYTPWQASSEMTAQTVFNLGLWRGAFDVNAIDKINGPEWNHPQARLRHASVIIPPGALVSVCSMNMHFRRSVVPAVYQLPMNISMMPGWVVDRYGDIWGGMILKRLMDIKGDLMSAGEPMIDHHKHGGFERNIWQEHMAHLLNDEFIALLDRCAAEVSRAGYLDMMDNFAEELVRGAADCSPLLARYVDSMAPSMRAWVRALR